MRITIEHSIDVATQEAFLAIYREAFAPLEPLAAARQALTDEEFRAQMNDPGVFKFLAWDENKQACAMAIMAADLRKVPWISPQYFAARFPEHFARQAIYYYQALLVRPDHQKSGTAGRMLEAVITKVAEDKAVAAIDCCRFTAEEVQFPAMVSAIASRLCHFEEWEMDSQHYYAYRSTGLLEPDVIDLREKPEQPVTVARGSASEQPDIAAVDAKGPARR